MFFFWRNGCAVRSLAASCGGGLDASGARHPRSSPSIRQHGLPQGTKRRRQVRFFLPCPFQSSVSVGWSDGKQRPVARMTRLHLTLSAFDVWPFFLFSSLQHTPQRSGQQSRHCERSCWHRTVCSLDGSSRATERRENNATLFFYSFLFFFLFFVLRGSSPTRGTWPSSEAPLRISRRKTSSPSSKPTTSSSACFPPTGDRKIKIKIKIKIKKNDMEHQRPDAPS